MIYAPLTVFSTVEVISLHGVVNRLHGASVGLCNTHHAVVGVIGVRSHAVCPVYDADDVVVLVIRIGHRRIVGVDQLREVADLEEFACTQEKTPPSFPRAENHFFDFY